MAAVAKASPGRIQQSDTLRPEDFVDLGNWIWSGETADSLALPAPAPGTPAKFYRVIRSHQAP